MNTCEAQYMNRAIELALLGTGYTSPNPLVGAVIVKDGRVIGEGYHERYGELHAERNALKHCKENPEGATMYVTLEPCCHQGKQPPCVEAIMEAKIGKVVVGSFDPNPLVAGKGISILREHGITVVEDFMRAECDAINPVFFHYIQTKMPYVVLKYAMTMDGKIATENGDSKWVTGEKAREHVHESRHRFFAIMVGIGTVLADNPMLNCRIPNGKNPIRIICDSNLRIPLNSQLVQTAKDIRTIIATCSKASPDKVEVQTKEEIQNKKEFAIADEVRNKQQREKIDELQKAGCELLFLPEKNGKVDLRILMKTLGEMGIDSVYVEGGGILHFSLLQENLVQSVHAYIAPKVIGGANAKSPVEGQGFPFMKDAITFQQTKITRLGEDILIEMSVD